MFSRGLRESEKQLLASAGFTPGLIAAVARESQTEPWKHLSGRERLFIVLACILFFLIAYAVIPGNAAKELSIAGAIFASIASLARLWTDARTAAFNRREPARWAARTLASLTREARAARTENSMALEALTGHAEAISGFDDPRAALREVAHRLKAQGQNPGLNARDVGSILIGLAISALIIVYVLVYWPF